METVHMISICQFATINLLVGMFGNKINHSP